MQISVIVPIYNVERYLKRCLDSLANQSFKDYEVILVNDGSTDNSGSIAQQFCEMHDKFYYYYKENGGLGSARNFGIERSSGDFLAFVDSDDWVESDFLKLLYEACIDKNADVAMCGIMRVWDNGSKKVFPSGFDKSKTTENIIKTVKFTSNVAWNKLYRRELFSNIRYPDRITFEDLATTPRVLLRAKKIVYIDKPLYDYYWRSDSIIVGGMKKVNNDILTAFHILEESEIGDEVEVLTYIYLKIVMCSYLWSLFELGDRENKWIGIVKKAKQKYSGCFEKKNLMNFNKRYRIFIYLCKLENKILINLYVKFFGILRDVKLSLNQKRGKK